MINKEKPLSEKIEHELFVNGILDVRDVAQAVERLKENIPFSIKYEPYDELIKQIDEIFGDLK